MTYFSDMMFKLSDEQLKNWVKINDSLWRRQVTVKAVIKTWHASGRRVRPREMVFSGNLVYNPEVGFWGIDYFEGDELLGRVHHSVCVFANKAISMVSKGAQSSRRLLISEEENVFCRRTDFGIEKLSVFVHGTEAELNDDKAYIKFSYSAVINNEFQDSNKVEFHAWFGDTNWHKALSTGQHSRQSANSY